MNLQMEELFNVLTHECFFAADRFKQILGVQTEGEYDDVFKHMSSAFQPIIMWDGLIPEEARKSIVRGVVERSDVNPEMHAQVNAEFLNYVRTNASENMAPFLDVLTAHYDAINYSGKDFQYPDVRFPFSLFYGEWMEDYSLKDDLQQLRKLRNHIDSSKFENKTLSREDHVALVASQLKKSADRKFFMDFVDRYSKHPKLSYILNGLCQEEYNIFHLGHSTFPKFETVLLDDTKLKLSTLTAEMNEHWSAFNSQRVSILSKLLSTSIQQRCVGLLRNMEHDVGADLSVTVAPLEKSNVEDFRNKNCASAPPASHKI